MSNTGKKDASADALTKKDAGRGRKNRDNNAHSKGDGLTENLIQMRRVSKVTKGGRIFSFSALVVVGDGKGRVGYGYGKARELPLAISKATANARRNMFTISLVEKGRTVLYKTNGRHGATKVMIKPASEGTGIIASGVMRAVFEVAGVRDIVTKCLGSRNPLNVLQATMNGLRSIVSPRHIARKRGKKVSELWGFASSSSKTKSEEGVAAA